MALAVTNNTKNTTTVTNNDKQSNQTWADMTIAWEDAQAPWAAAGSAVVKDTKNSTTVTNVNKN